jgi:hypothetical protein
MVGDPETVYRLTPATERGRAARAGLESVALGEQDLRSTLRQALQAVGHPAAALTLVANQARLDPDLDDAIAAAMRQAIWRQIVREELCGDEVEAH